MVRVSAPVFDHRFFGVSLGASRFLYRSFGQSVEFPSLRPRKPREQSPTETGRKPVLAVGDRRSIEYRRRVKERRKDVAESVDFP